MLLNIIVSIFGKAMYEKINLENMKIYALTRKRKIGVV